MALDTKQKRGSAIGLLLPWRQWLGEPGESNGSLRLSLVRLCSATFDDGADTDEAPIDGALGYRVADTRPHYRARGGIGGYRAARGQNQ